MKEQNFNSGHCKALLLFSGGLDSLLVYYILKRENIDVQALIFKTPFFTEEKTVGIAEKNHIKFRVVELGQSYIDNILIHPSHGYGKNLNPCIDCHGYMVSKAKEILEQEDYNFIATGDVLNQRPMSQNRGALMELEKFTDTQGMILRPLSAKLLPQTEVEKSGCIDRNKLFDINGRSRKVQLNLTKELGISYFSSPGGGCLLTDPGYSKKARILLKFFENPLSEYFEIIKFGRMFFIDDSIIILGRNHSDNIKLKEFSHGEYYEPINIPGPSAIFFGDKTKKDYLFDLISIYSDAENGQKVDIKFGDFEKIGIIKNMDKKNSLRKYLI